MSFNCDKCHCLQIAYHNVQREYGMGNAILGKFEKRSRRNNKC